MTGVSGAALRSAMAGLPTGVSVVTTRVQDDLHAVTVGSLVSVSLEPPLVAFFVRSESRFGRMVSESGQWAASILRASDADIARVCAGSIRPGPSALDSLPHALGAATGLPILVGCRAHFECETEEISPAGDHDMVLGRVLAVGEVNNDTEHSLVFYNRGFHFVTPVPE